LLPKLFFYIQIVIYVVAGVFLVAISINIFANFRADRPLNIKALLKNATRIYPALFAYGALVSIYILLAQKADNFIIGETFKFAIQHIPNTAPRIYAFITPLFFFITNVILQVFIILALPLIVLQKRSSIKALANSFYLGARHFSKLFVLIFIPFLLYLPIYLLESYSAKLAEISLPEINLYIMGFGIAVTMFVNYLITMCAVQFLLEITPAEIKK